MQPASNAIQSIATQSKQSNQMQPASNAIHSIATQSKQSNHSTQRQGEMQRNPANAITSNFTTLPVTTIPVTHSSLSNSAQCSWRKIYNFKKQGCKSLGYTWTP